LEICALKMINAALSSEEKEVAQRIVNFNGNTQNPKILIETIFEFL